MGDRRRDLRWKTFRRDILEAKSIVFRSRADLSGLSTETLSAVEAICGGVSQEPHVDQLSPEWVVNEENFRKSPFSPVLTDCVNPTMNRSGFSGNHIACDSSFSDVLADTNATTAYGLRSATFKAEEVNLLPPEVIFPASTTKNGTRDLRQDDLLCPYLFIEKATTSARHDMESAVNRCALDGAIIFDALKTIYYTPTPYVRDVDIGLNLMLFTLAMTESCAVLHMHRFMDNSFIIAPMCKFDLRKAEHKGMLHACMQAIDRWAENSFLPSTRRALEEFADWYEVVNDPLNMRPATRSAPNIPTLQLHKTFETQQTPRLGALCERIRAHTDAGAAGDIVIPATSAGLHFPSNTYGLTSRVLSWQRETIVWQEMPLSASLVPDKRCGDEVNEEFYKSRYVPLQSIPETERRREQKISHSKNRPLLPSIMTARSKPEYSIGGSIIDRRKVPQGITYRKHDLTQSACVIQSDSTAIPGLQSTSVLGLKTLPLPTLDNHFYPTPSSSDGTRFEDEMPLSSNRYEDLVMGAGAHARAGKSSNATECLKFPKYQGVEDWARDQQTLFEVSGEDVRLIEPIAKVNTAIADITSLCTLANALPAPSEAMRKHDTDDDDRSVSSWIDRVLGERMFCVG